MNAGSQLSHIACVNRIPRLTRWRSSFPPHQKRDCLPKTLKDFLPPLTCVHQSKSVLIQAFQDRHRDAVCPLESFEHEVITPLPRHRHLRQIQLHRIIHRVLTRGQERLDALSVVLGPVDSGSPYCHVGGLCAVRCLGKRCKHAVSIAHRPLSTEEDRLGRESDELVSRRNGERICTEEQAVKVMGFSGQTGLWLGQI